MCLCVQVRVYELGQLSLKFERHFDAEIVDFQVFPSARASFSAVSDSLLASHSSQQQPLSRCQRSCAHSVRRIEHGRCMQLWQPTEIPPLNLMPELTADPLR